MNDGEAEAWKNAICYNPAPTRPIPDDKMRRFRELLKVRKILGEEAFQQQKEQMLSEWVCYESELFLNS